MTSTDLEERPDAEPEVPAEAAASEAHGISPQLRNRLLVPLLLPACAVLFIAFVALNISRVFLAGKGLPAIWVASILTIVILFSATAIASTRGSRTPTLALFVMGGLLIVLIGGTVTLGASQEKKTAAKGEDLTNVKPVTVISLTAGPALAFNPNQFTDVPAGVVQFDVTAAAAGHTFTILGTPVDLQLTQAKKYSVKVRLAPNTTYNFECTIPGHAAAGMKGTIKTGAPGAAPAAGATPTTAAAG